MLFPVVAGVSVRLSRCCHPLRPQPSRACSALAAGRAGSCCSQRRAPASSRSPCSSVSCAVAAAEAKGAASWCDASQRAACFAGGPVHAGSLPPLSLTNQFTSAVSSADLVLRFGRPLRPDQIPGGPKAAAAATAAVQQPQQQPPQQQQQPASFPASHRGQPPAAAAAAAAGQHFPSSGHWCSGLPDSLSHAPLLLEVARGAAGITDDELRFLCTILDTSPDDGGSGGGHAG